LSSRGKNNLPSLTKFIVMLEQISELVKQFGRQAVVENPDIPNEQNNAVLAEATNTIAGGMQNMLAVEALRTLSQCLREKIRAKIHGVAGLEDY
jgi:hypothetical protein